MKIDLKTNLPLKKFCKTIVQQLYPDYKGRKIFAQIQDESIDCNYNANWGGGSRTYYKFVRTDNNNVLVPPDFAPWNRPNEMLVTLPKGCICVTHTIFQGHECGCTVYFSAEDMQKLLPSETTCVA